MQELEFQLFYVKTLKYIYTKYTTKNFGNPFKLKGTEIIIYFLS